MADLMQEDPARAIRNAIARIRLHLSSPVLAERMDERADRASVEPVIDCLEPELEILERCAKSVEHVRMAIVTLTPHSLVPLEVTPGTTTGLWTDKK